MAVMHSALTRALLLGGVAAVLAVASPARAADYKMTILHVNALQSRLEPVTESGAVCTPEDVQAHRCAGGVARLAARIKAEKATANNVVVVSTGNAFTGSNFYDVHKQRALSETMNLMGFDAMTVGDREFVDGTEMLSRFHQSVRFPLLGANVDVQKDPYMKDRIYPFIATYIGREQVALIGYSTEHLIALAKPTGIVHVEPIEVALRRWMKQLTMMGVNKVIAISHAGLERDRQIAGSIDGLDVIIGNAAAGHAAGAKAPAKPPSLQTLKGPGGPVVLAHAAEFGRSLGRLDVTFDPKGHVKTSNGHLFELGDGSAEDQGLKDLVASLATSTAALPPAAGAPKVR
jgi:5'-nucleotidase